MYITWSEAWQKTTVLVTRLFGRFVSRSVEAAKSGRDSRFRRRSGCFVASKKPDNAEIPGQASRYRPMSCPVRDFLPHSADAIARALKARSIWRVLVVRCVAAARGLRVPDDARRLWHVHARDRSQHPVGIAFEQAHVVAREVGDGQKAPVGRRRKVPRPLPSGRNVAAPRNPSLAIHREDDQLVASAHRRVQLPPVGRERDMRRQRVAARRLRQTQLLDDPPCSPPSSIRNTSTSHASSFTSAAIGRRGWYATMRGPDPAGTRTVSAAVGASIPHASTW